MSIVLHRANALPFGLQRQMSRCASYERVSVDNLISLDRISCQYDTVNEEKTRAQLKAEIAKLIAVRESATTPAEIKAAIEAVDNASSEFAARRMDASIKKALHGQSVDEV